MEYMVLVIVLVFLWVKDIYHNRSHKGEHVREYKELYDMILKIRMIEKGKAVEKDTYMCLSCGQRHPIYKSKAVEDEGKNLQKKN